MNTIKQFAVCGGWMEYDEVFCQQIEVFSSEEEAEAARDAIEEEDRYNTMYDWYDVRRV